LAANIPLNRRDAMKSVLLPVDQNEQMLSAFETARLAASVLEGQVEGAALAPVSVENEVDYSKRMQRRFDEYTARHSIERAEHTRFRWRGDSVIQDAALGSLARVYDMTVLNRPGARGGRMAALENALFESGRPVLMAPPSPPTSLGQTVVIHWNASTEVCRAISMALPILRKAKRVVVLGVEGSMVPGPSGRDAVMHLEYHDIAASEKSVSNRGQRPGAVLLAEARALGADLLIKGAYTQSRLRQMIFGGATQHVLTAAELPVFLVD
jgi:nucleotide-binding universal stress UspA family protein